MRVAGWGEEKRRGHHYRLKPRVRGSESISTPATSRSTGLDEKVLNWDWA